MLVLRGVRSVGNLRRRAQSVLRCYYPSNDIWEGFRSQTEVGGALTILAAVRVPEMDAGACFYGIPPLDAADLKKIKIPLICHFANKDDWCTPAKVNELESALKQSKSQFELYRYEAHHAFMNEAHPEVYDAASAKTAWERTLKFLKKALT